MKAANFFPRFSDLTNKDLLVDFHLHSVWSDGKNSILEITNHSKLLGLNTIAITDHIRKESAYFYDYKKEIEYINCLENISVLVGFEAKVNNFDGDIDVKSEIVKEVDIAIVSVHRFPLGNKLFAAKFFSSDIAQAIELELSIAALQRGGFNVLGHPGGMSLSAHGEFVDEYFEKIIAACRDNNIAFDLNGRYHKAKINVLLPLLKKYNPYVSIGTDSHDILTMGKWNEYLKSLL